jgi:hypothetical protein
MRSAAKSRHGLGWVRGVCAKGRRGPYELLASRQKEESTAVPLHVILAAPDSGRKWQMLVGKFCEDRAVVGKCRTARASGVKTSFAPPPLAPALQPTWLDQPGAARWSYRQATAGVRTIRRQSAVRSVTRPVENGFPQSAVRSVTLHAGRPFCCGPAASTEQNIGVVAGAACVLDAMTTHIMFWAGLQYDKVLFSIHPYVSYRLY